MVLVIKGEEYIVKLLLRLQTLKRPAEAKQINTEFCGTNLAMSIEQLDHPDVQGLVRFLEATSIKLHP